MQKANSCFYEERIKVQRYIFQGDSNFSQETISHQNKIQYKQTWDSVPILAISILGY